MTRYHSRLGARTHHIGHPHSGANAYTRLNVGASHTPARLDPRTGSDSGTTMPV